MANSWLPTWAQALWTAVFVAVLVVHLRHVATMRGRARLWHMTHVLMALGMLDMVWPGHSMPVGADGGEIVFGLAGLAALGLVGIDAARGEAPVWLWLIVGLDLATMVYMFAMTSTRITVLSVVLAAWFVAEAVGWLSGILSALARRTGLGLPLRYVTQTMEMAATSAPATGAVSTVSMPEVPENDPVFGVPVRVSLALMSIGMSYMFLAMQFGMGPMAAMTHGGPAMPGM